MTFTPDQIAMLEAPLSREHVKERTQAGRQFSYLEAWHVISEANRIFGFDGWNRETVECRCVTENPCRIGKPPYEKDGYRVGYIARCRIVVCPTDTISVTREGTGYGSGIDVDVGAAHESAIKEAESDAMKRALMTFGNQFGLALYDRTQANVEAPQRSAPAQPEQAPSTPQLRVEETCALFEKALKAATTGDQIDRIVRGHISFLTELKALNFVKWNKLAAAVGTRRNELAAGAPVETRGSAPALMGEP